MGGDESKVRQSTTTQRSTQVVTAYVFESSGDRKARGFVIGDQRDEEIAEFTIYVITEHRSSEWK